MKVCTSIISENFESLLKQLAESEMAEIRLDLCGTDRAQLIRIGQEAKAKNIAWIATFREKKPSGGFFTAEERSKGLMAAMDAGADYIDIEIESEPHYRQILSEYAGQKACKLLISYHDFECTRSLNELLSVYKEARQMGADVVKIITTAQHAEDAKTILELYDSLPEERMLVAFAMGSEGSISRWKCLLKGAPFTYASAAVGAESAPGQLSAKEIRAYLEPKIFGIIGKPVSHSLSPVLFRAAFPDQTNWNFLRIAADSAQEGIRIMKELRLRGMNVTAPFKSDVLNWVDDMDESVRIMGAANTLTLDDDGRIRAFNTDHWGVLGSLRDFKADPKGKKCLVLGAGGAARAAVYALTQAGGQVCVVNRSEDRAKALATDFGIEYCVFPGADQATAVQIESIRKKAEACSIIVNTLPAGIRMLADNCIFPHHTLLDASYHGSVYFETAQAQKCRFISGLYWLIHQGIAAYELFTGTRPNAENMENELLSTDRIPPSNFSFIGLMGSGKSTAARQLSLLMHLPLLDTDKQLEELWGKKISTMVEEKGIQFLREEEALHIPLWLEDFSGLISCGGGVVSQPRLRQALKELSYPIWMYASPKECLERISDIRTRPLLAQSEDPLQTLSKIAFERNPWYAETAALLIPVGGKQKEEVADRLALELHHLMHT